MFNRTNRRTRRSSKSVSAVAMQPLEQRQMMSATSTKVVDIGGRIEFTAESGGQVFVATSLASGASVSQIYVANGVKSKTKLLLDLNAAGSTVSSISDLVATDDGRIFFAASAPGGRQLFQLNTKTGAITQITKKVGAGPNLFVSNLEAAGGRLFYTESTSGEIRTLAPGSTVEVVVKKMDVDSDFKAAGSVVYFAGTDQAIYRSDGTAAGTVKVSGTYTVGRNDFFTSNDHVYFEGSKNGENTSLFRVGVSQTTPVKLADDFTLFSLTHTELGDYVYLSGGYSNLSPLGKGRELYRVHKVTGAVELAYDAGNTNGAGDVTGIGSIGNSVYFVAGDGEFLNSQGTTDRELFRYDAVTGKTVKVTKNNDLYPIEIGQGALSSYYFAAAPTKDDARFGSRKVYRTNPVTDAVELVEGLPSYTDSNGNLKQDVVGTAVGSRGFFYIARTDDKPGNQDLFFSAAPFSLLDPKTTILTVTATSAADVLTMRVEGAELVVTLNGVEERHVLANVGRIEVYCGAGNDSFTAEQNVAVNTYVFGDLGDDSIQTGSGQDTLTGGAGKNFLFGGDNNDRLNGSGGRDFLDGQLGDDRLYGNAGSDDLTGGAGVDRLFGGDGADILRGGSSNDKLYGEAGNDTLAGGNQSDLLIGGDGDDAINGDVGNDTLIGNAGADALDGGAGDDTFDAVDTAADSLFGGDGTDTARLDAGTESVVDLIEVIA